MITALKELPETANKGKHMWASDSMQEKSIAFVGQKSFRNNWEHFVGACQNAEQILHQKSKQFTEHWQTRAEEGSLVSTE